MFSSLRPLGYLWAFPVTAIGLCIAFLSVLTGGRTALKDGVIEASGGWLRWILRGGAAMALGHVILARNSACLNQSRHHELKHVRQYERWGPLLLPLYLFIALWLRLRGHHPYLDHPLEPPPKD